MDRLTMRLHSVVHPRDNELRVTLEVGYLETIEVMFNDRPPRDQPISAQLLWLTNLAAAIEAMTER